MRILILLVILFLSSLVFAADNVVYVDASLGTGDNDGTTWANAYQGTAGLQAAFDADWTGAQNTTIYIRNTFTISATMGIDGATTTPNDGYYVNVIGCDSSTGNPLTIGNYTTITAAGTDLGAGAIKIIDAERWRFYNIKVMDNDSAGGGSGAGEDGWVVDDTASKKNLSWYNCWVTNCHTAWSSADFNRDIILLMDCVATDIDDTVLELRTFGTTIIRGYFAAADGQKNYYHYEGYGFIDGAIFVGGDYGAYLDLAGVEIIKNCVFYSQGSHGIYVDDAGTRLIALNNIFYPDAYDGDNAIYTNAGTVLYEDFNISNCDATHQLNGGAFTGSNSHGALSFTNTDPLVNASGGDFRLNIGQTVCDTYALDKGPRMWMGSDADNTNKGYSSIGAWQATQTQAGGGGGAVIGGGVVR